MALCACGCGQSIPPQKGRGRPRKYVAEHAPDKRVRPERRQPRVLRLEPAEVEVERSDAVTAASRSRLETAERLSTPEGAVALHLARLIDQGDYNAQGAAALSKAWSEALTRALLGSKGAPDLVDELRERRRARQAAMRRL